MNKAPRISAATRRVLKPSSRQAEQTMYFSNPAHQNLEDSLFVESAPVELQDISTKELFGLAFELRRRLRGVRTSKDIHEPDAISAREMNRLKLRSISKELERRQREAD